MTTSNVSTLASATACAMAAVRLQHCPPPDLRPAAAVRGVMPCTRCQGRLTFTDGRTTGRCSSSGCIRWSGNTARNAAPKERS
ncbi:hypothetical protein [Variovorax sp. RA8]|uniref:hypothetical protein n=1 Tax=Variovorax sp. (strain JCM 16519 / RA8) TaxID=662548 RepID=UPI0013173ED3|nr:hypothetical protein [Variovorax sp. RA8]VTU28360.1 hypothetical protein RA8CHR_03735 [Variovorax sp. RA8]